MAPDDSEAKLLAFLVLGVVAGIIFFINGLKKQKRLRLIENIPTSTVRSMAVGLVEVKGSVVPFEKTHLSPFSDQPCVYFQYKVQELRRSGKSSYWATVVQNETRDWFFLKDNTGQVLVSPERAEMDIAPDHQFSNSWASGEGITNEIEERLGSLGVDTRSWLGFGKRMRIYESFLSPGDEVYVMGAATLLGNNAPPAGATQNLLIGKGESGGVFFISEKSEKKILTSMRIQMLGGIYGGAVLSTACVTLLVGFYLRYGSSAFAF